MNIRLSTPADEASIHNLHSQAFGAEKGVEVADLAIDLMHDQTSLPLYSFVATEDNTIIGHILFTHVTISGDTDHPRAQILAPLAISPTHQNKGIGVELINEGLAHLKNEGVELVFVLGHPGYYPRAGFAPAGKQGLDAPTLSLKKMLRHGWCKSLKQVQLPAPKALLNAQKL